MAETPNTPPDSQVIPLSGGMCAIVDTVLFNDLNNYYWRAVKSKYCWYAVRRHRIAGKDYSIKMHRLIAETPPFLQCHHKNLNSLDNRKCNLQNMSWSAHANLHRSKMMQKTSAGPVGFGC